MAKHRPLPLLDLLPSATRLLPPLCVALGSPAQAARIAACVGAACCFQFDHFQAERLRRELERENASARVVTGADLWDLPAEYQTVIYPVEEGGERGLKLDIVEQAYHILRPRGTLVVLSPYLHDDLFPPLLKKVYGKSQAPVPAQGQLIWATRGEDGPRRRHEVTFHATVSGDGPREFLSRPGVFSYGKMDLGARALLEVAIIQTGDRVLDLGCGCGANGVFASHRAGPTGSVTFLDTNVRAIAVAEHNARANGLTQFKAIAALGSQTLPACSFDVVLANPPYYAQDAIARSFIEQGLRLLRPRGRFYLVTKKWEAIGQMAADIFNRVEVVNVRDYGVVRAEAPGVAPANGLRRGE